VKSARTYGGLCIAANYDARDREAFVDGVELTVGSWETRPSADQARNAARVLRLQAKYSAKDTRYIIPSGLPLTPERIIPERHCALSGPGLQRGVVWTDGRSHGEALFPRGHTSPGMTTIRSAHGAATPGSRRTCACEFSSSPGSRKGGDRVG